MPIQDPEKTIAEYKAAFRAANGYTPHVFYKRGWFSILQKPGDATQHKQREFGMIQMTENLLARAKAQADK